MIWRDKREGGDLWLSLRRRGKLYNKRAGKTAGRGLIPNRIDISERPAVVGRKSRVGDWEGDTVAGARHKGGLLTLVERKTRLTKIVLLSRATADATRAAAVRRSASRPSYQQQLAWALEERPALLTGEGYSASLRAIPRLIDLLHAAGVAVIVRPQCPGCHRVVRIDKPLGGVRVCRTCIARSRAEQCARCGARREPVTRDDQGRPLCANCFITDPANLETCTGCGRRRRVERRTADGPLCSR